MKDPLDDDFPYPHLDDPRINDLSNNQAEKKRLAEAKERLDRQEKVRKFERETEKEAREWNRKPWWQQQQEAGDYHYNDFDMEPREEEEK